MTGAGTSRGGGGGLPRGTPLTPTTPHHTLPDAGTAEVATQGEPHHRGTKGKAEVERRGAAGSGSNQMGLYKVKSEVVDS